METPAVSAAPRAIELPRGHGELILVVDDDPSVREVTQWALEEFGYRTVLAANGAEAIAIYVSQGLDIAAVLTDMNMPVMDGFATIQVLRKINPKVRIVAASGLFGNGAIEYATGLGARRFLVKPYPAETLLKVLEQILTEESEGAL